MNYYLKLILLSVLLPLRAFTQNQNEESKVEEAVKPYELTNVAAAIQSTDEQLRAALEIANDSVQNAKVEQELNLIIGSYRNSEIDTVLVDFNKLTLWGLKDENQKWLGVKDELTAYNTDLGIYLVETTSFLEITEVLSKKWAVTKLFADTSDVSEELKKSINKALQATLKTNQKLKAKQEILLLLENRASKELLEINGIINDISKIRIERSKDIFLADAPLLFQEMQHGFSGNYFSLFKASLKTSREAIGTFVSENQKNVFFHILAFLVLWVLLFLIKREFLKSNFEAEKNYDVTAKILSAPLTNALLLAITLSGTFYDSFPNILRDILVLLVLIPVVRLLPRVLSQKKHDFFYFLAAMVVLEKMQSQLAFDQLSQRLLLLLLSIMGMVGFVLFLLPRSEFYKSVKASNRKWMLYVLGGFIIILAAATYGNFNGNFQLSLLLTTGVVHAFTVGIVVFLAINIVRAAFLYIIHSGLSGKVNILITYKKQVEDWSFLLISLLGFWIWIKAALRGFALLTPVQELLTAINQTSWHFGEITLSVSNIVNFITILAIFIVIANTVNILLREEILTRFDLRKGVPLALSILSRYVILILGFVLAMSSAGISLSKLNLLIGALGVGIGFGLQSIVSNFVSGLVIIFERPVHIGDIVTAGLVEGEVTEIGLRSSRIKTYDGAEVIVPNNDLISNQVTNWTFSDKRRRVERIVYIDNGPSPREVKNVIDAVLKAQDGLLKDPESKSYFLGFEDNALKFRILLWMSEGILTTPSELLMNLHDALTANGYKTYMPVQKVVLEQDDNKTPAFKVIGAEKNKADEQKDESTD